MNQIFVNAKKVLVLLAEMSDDMRSRIIHEVANSIITHQTDLLDANSDDLSRMDPESPIYDRLKLTTKRLKDIADSMHTVADMPSPVRRVVQHKVLPNGLDLLRQSVPYGVIGVIYEARPNVTFDVFSLCYKSGNACILKGGKDAQATNEAAVALIQEVLHRYSPTAYACQLMPATHEATAELLQARGYVDLCIPRGGKKLIEFVRDNAKVPCIETGAGVVHTFFDKSGDTDMGAAIINNAKTRRPAVCNSLDTLLIHELRLNYDVGHGVDGLCDGRPHRPRHGRSDTAYLRPRIRSQRVYHHRRRHPCASIPTARRCRLRLLECVHRLHRRRPVWSRCRDRHQHPEARSPWSYGH